MRRKPLSYMQCSMAKALDVVGDQWTMLILRDALQGVTRFDELATRLDIPRATLTARLDHLCASGVLERRRYQDRPPRHEYVLTDKGRALRPVVVTLTQWGDQWARDDDPPIHLINESTGARIDPVLVDRSTGIPLNDLQVRAVGQLADGVAAPNTTNTL